MKSALWVIPGLMVVVAGGCLVAPASDSPAVIPEAPQALAVMPSEQLSSAASAATPAARTVQTEMAPFEQFSTKLDTLADCLDQQNCAFDNSDPRAYSHAVALAQRDLLVAANTAWLARDLSEQEARVLAHRGLALADGHAQSAALDLLASLPLHANSGEALLAMLSASHDAALVEQALPLVAAYQDNGLVAALDPLLITVLEHGPHFVRLSLSRELLPLVTADNADSLQQLAKRLAADDAVQRNLQLALSQYQLLQNRG